MTLRWNQAAKPAVKTEQAHDTSASDILDLFRKFDAEPAQYQEIMKEKSADVSQSRWPMMAKMSIAAAASAPAVTQPSSAFLARQARVPASSPAEVPQRGSQAPFAGKPAVVEPTPLAAVFQRLMKTPAAPSPTPSTPLFKRFRSL